MTGWTNHPLRQMPRPRVVYMVLFSALWIAVVIATPLTMFQAVIPMLVTGYLEGIWAQRRWPTPGEVERRASSKKRRDP